MRRAVGLGTGLLLGVGIVLTLGGQDNFPHDEHAGLFPACVGCHAGAVSGEPSRMVSIGLEDCAACHDGARLDRVSWTMHEAEATNLDFSHVDHAREMGETGRAPLACEDCHRRPGAEERMQVVLAAAETCLGCHQPEVQDHLARTTHCAFCHLPLARASELPVEHIAAFPRPPDHEAAGFLFAHGEGATQEGTAACEVCHARESCERCHLNAGELPAIMALSPDARVAMLVADRPGEWPEPPSHDRTDWVWAHGDVAEREIGECASCHTQPSCETCHGTGLALLSDLPEPGPEGRRGVILADVEAVHPFDFATQHGTAAAVGRPNCASCHTEEQCAACHDGPARPGFHPVDFVLRHGADAFGSETECASCHSTEAFCRDCHMASGFAAGGRTGGAFHDAVPDWLLAHGQAARQELEACTACHDQSTCLRCHSAKSGLRINPHGPGFDPDRVAARSQQACGICHFSLPMAP